MLHDAIHLLNFGVRNAGAIGSHQQQERRGRSRRNERSRWRRRGLVRLVLIHAHDINAFKSPYIGPRSERKSNVFGYKTLGGYM